MALLCAFLTAAVVLGGFPQLLVLGLAHRFGIEEVRAGKKSQRNRAGRELCGYAEWT